MKTSINEWRNLLRDTSASKNHKTSNNNIGFVFFLRHPVVWPQRRRHAQRCALRLGRLSRGKHHVWSCWPQAPNQSYPLSHAMSWWINMHILRPGSMFLWGFPCPCNAEINKIAYGFVPNVKNMAVKSGNCWLCGFWRLCVTFGEVAWIFARPGQVTSVKSQQH